MENIKNLVEKNIKKHLNIHLPNHQIKEVYCYALFPSGKLFRSQLIAAIYQDLTKRPIEQVYNDTFSDHSLLSSSIELHHTYSLIHDDLPSLDNDDIRRGRPSTHKKFDEAKALLVGNGLLNLSYNVLFKIKSPKRDKLLSLAGRCFGPKGIIHGQILDIYGNKKSFSSVMETNNYKTTKLILLAIVGGYLLIDKKYLINKCNLKELIRLSNNIGTTFQLLDDLCDIKQKDDLNETNAWLCEKTLANKELESAISFIKNFIDKYNMSTMKEIINNYYKIVSKNLDNKREIIKNYIPKKITEYDIYL